MLSEVPKGWDKARIDAVLQRNTTSVSVTELAAEGLVAHYSLPAFDANKKPVIESGSEIKSNKTAIDKDCLLFSKLNPRIPRVWRVRHFGEQKPVCSTEFWALKPKTGEISLSYAEYFLGWNGFLSHPTIKPASSTNSHQRVDRKAFDAFMLPLPPLNEQHRIAEILSSVDASIQATQAVIEQAERVKRGLMEELLTGGLGSEAIERGELPKGWITKTLTEIAKVATGKHDANHATEGGRYRFYTCAADFFACNTKRFSGGCIILPGNGANVGEVYYYDGEFDAYQRTYVVSEIDVNKRFLLHHLKRYWRERNVNKQYGSATNFLKMGNFKTYKVCLPPQSEQERIAEILSSIDEFIASQKLVVEQQSRAKRGLMDDLLTGKVRTV